MDNFFKNKKVVVTGGSGFIGTHFLKELVNRGARVRTSTNNAQLQFESDELIEIDTEGDQDILRVLLPLGYAESFAKRANMVVGAGRVPCPFCGGPIDPAGHLCPRANGYRR